MRRQATSPSRPRGVSTRPQPARYAWLPRSVFWLAVLYALATLHFGGYAYTPDYDAASAWGANVYADHGLALGRDVAHVWGPLGWLFYPVALHGHLEMAWGAHLALRLLLVALVIWHAQRTREYWGSAGFLAVCGAVMALPLAEIHVVAVCLACWLLAQRHQELRLACLASILTGLWAPTKFNLFLMLLGLWLVQTALWLQRWPQERRRVLWLVLALVLALVLPLASVWLFHFQAPAHVARWLQWSWQLATSNSEAMALPGHPLEIGLALLAFFALPVLAWGLGCRICSGLGWAWGLSVLGLGYVAFKHGLVRPDALHLHHVFRSLPLLAASLLLLWPQRLPALVCAAVLGLAVAGPAVRFEPLALGVPLAGWRQLATTAARLKESWRLADTGQLQRQALARELAMVGDGRLEIAPAHASALHGTGARWRPSPFFQYFLARTPATDTVNAAHVCGPEAADFVLWSPHGLDGQHPLHLAPQTHLALRRCYEPAQQSASGLLLRKSAPQLEARRPLGQVAGAWNQPLAIPAAKGQVQARFTLDYSPLGRLLKAAAWVPPMYLMLDDQRLRLTPGAARSGVLVTGLPQSMAAYAAFFAGATPPLAAPRQLRLVMDQADLYFQPDIRVEFTELLSLQEGS